MQGFAPSQHRHIFRDLAGAGFGLLDGADAIEDGVAIGPGERREESGGGGIGVEGRLQVGGDQSGAGGGVGLFPAAVGLGGSDFGGAGGAHSPLSNQLLRAGAVLLRPFARALARREAGQPPGIVERLELAVDPAVAQSGIDRLGFGQSFHAGAALREFEPDAGCASGLGGQPGIEFACVRKGQDRQAGTHFAGGHGGDFA